jgi:uncharacterized membrane protein
VTIRLVRPTVLSATAAVASVSIIAFTAAFLLSQYESLPWLLPVHFNVRGYPNGWQYKTHARVLTPMFVQLALTITLGAVAVLLLSRRGTAERAAAAETAETAETPDVRAAAAAAEAVLLLAFIWVAFQAYAAIALAAMWQRERAGLDWYTPIEVACVILTVAISIRAHVRLGRPAPRPFVPEHWRYGQLYKNSEDPALFVPTRNGKRWTLNFGRPVAAALMGIVLMVGVVAPTVILLLMLR